MGEFIFQSCRHGGTVLYTVYKYKYKHKHRCISCLGRGMAHPEESGWPLPAWLFP